MNTEREENDGPSGVQDGPFVNDAAGQRERGRARPETRDVS